MAGLAKSYEALILDLWGTIHDGIRPWPGVIPCLEELKRRGKKILVLSNAPRRSYLSVARMDEMGIPRASYDGVLTSGEAAHDALVRAYARERTGPVRRILLLGPPKDDSVLEDVPHRRVERIEDADLVVTVGTRRRQDHLSEYESFLAAAQRRGLPMICCNPDYEVMRGADRELCAGAIARRYEELGGKVEYHGKPHAPIYAESLRRLGANDRARVLAVGDALRTDIAGAAAFGLDTVLVTSTGILAETLGIAPYEDPAPAALDRLCAAEGQRPTAAIAAFRW
jgi:HAD superfamily hydrolase (TIGR01459 family)